MPPSALLLPSWRKTCASAVASASGEECQHAKTQMNESSAQSTSVRQQEQQQEWAPSQIIRLQRIERIERESFTKSKADAHCQNNIQARSDSSKNNNNDEEDALSSNVQDFDVDEIFALSPATCPNMRGPAPPVLITPDPSPCSASPRAIANADPSAHTRQCDQRDASDDALKLKIFTGSWNMAAQDPFADKKGQYIGDERAASDLSEFLPLGYDLYVVGTQEKMASKHFHSAMLARLNSAAATSEPCPTKYVQLVLCASTPSERSSMPRNSSPLFGGRDSNNNGNDSFVDSRMRASSFGLVSTSASNHSSGSEPVSQSNSFTAASDAHALAASKASKPPKLSRSRSGGHEVRGRGDGAFLHSKATSMAMYIAAHLVSAVEVVRTGAHKFSLASGSKGGIAVMLRVAGSEQTITFVNCHLEANRPDLRRQQLATLAQKLPRAMGFGSCTNGKGNNSNNEAAAQLDLAACSDHVVWMGDFNYRIHSLDGDSVLQLLATNRHMELHDRYDSMQDDMRAVDAMRRFREPHKWPSFFPTYKKLPHRTGVSAPAAAHDATAADPSWPLRVYRVRYREPFYKGGRVKARVPGWCDRILIASSPAWRSCLEVERVPCELSGDAAADSGLSLRDNYRSVNDSLCGSDHSPVFCTFIWTVACC